MKRPPAPVLWMIVIRTTDDMIQMPSQIGAATLLARRLALQAL